MVPGGSLLLVITERRGFYKDDEDSEEAYV